MVDYCKGLEEQYAKIQEIGPRVIPKSIMQAQPGSMIHELPRTALEFQAQSISSASQRYANSMYAKSAPQLHQAQWPPVYPTNY